MNVVASRGQLRASLLRWALFLVPLIVLLGYMAGQFGSPDTQWFQNLAKPDIYPEPKWFGIVWTILYIMIGFAFAMICSAWGARGRGIAVAIFVIHFALNLAWSPTFFGAQNIEGALILIGLIDITLLIVIWLFWRVRRAAGLLLLPYLAWLLFATMLNYEFLRLNPDGGHDNASSATQRIEI